MGLAVIALATTSLCLLIALVSVTTLNRRRQSDLRAELEQSNAAMHASETELARVCDQLSAQVAESASLREELRAAVAEHQQTIDTQESLLATQASQLDNLNNQIVHLEELAQRQSRQHGKADPATLWQLELARSERTWRHFVSVQPDAPSPFATTDHPLRLAVEIEAAALREEVGAFLSVDWRAGAVDNPARAHLILRLAQELLAQAARDPYPVELVVANETAAADTEEPPNVADVSIAPETAVRLWLISPEDTDHIVAIEPPSIASDMVSFSNDERPLVIVS